MFHGSLVALVTPMKDNGELDVDRLRHLVDWHVDAGSDGIVAVGTTGEGALLDDKEKLAVIRHVVEQAKERIPVIAGTHAISTKHTIELTFSAMEAGVDACLIMTPAYVRPSQEGLYQHYKAIAEKVAVPLILYNVPKRSGCDLLPETLARLADVSNIIGIKEATASLERYQQIKALCGERLDIYAGDDTAACDLMLHGAKGTIGVAPNVVPDLFKQMCQAAIAGDEDQAKILDKQLQPLYECLALESNPISCKWALMQKGLILPGMRLPLTPLSDEYHDRFRSVLVNLGVLN